MKDFTKFFSLLVIGGVFSAGLAKGAPPAGNASAAWAFDGEIDAPVLTAISPSGATVGHATLILNVSGSGFLPASTIQWNGTNLATTYVSSSQLQAVIPAGALTTAGSFPVTVVDPAPASVASSAQTFTVGPAAAAPYFSLAGGTYTSSHVLKLTASTTGAAIHYTYTPLGAAPTTASATYSEDGITIDHSGVVEAITVAPGFSQSPISSKAYIYTPEQAAAAPSFSLPAGNYDTAQTLWLSDSTPGAMIYFTTDGSSPTASSTPYSGPITVASTELIEAVAVATGLKPSPVSAKSYKFTGPPVAVSPYFTLPGGTYSTSQTLSLTDPTPGAKIYYTTDGSSPIDDGTLYTGPITVKNTELVIAVAEAPGYKTSPASAKLYTFQPAP